MSKISFVALFVVSLGGLVACQSQSVEGVYGGVEMSVSAMVGGGMQRSDIVLYLRPDGTFTDALHKPDWRTDVKGTYVVKNQEVVLTYAGKERKTTHEIHPKGYLLAYGQSPLFPMVMDKKVPAGGFKYTGGSGGGGGLSGITYVGSFSQRTIYFDGKGTFSHKRFSSTVVAGGQVGGGSTRGDDQGGTYEYKNGVLQLKYRNGQQSTHSLFFMEGKDPFLALDGYIYMPDKPEEADQSQTKSEAKQVPKVLSPAELLTKVREVQGGDALDAISTIHIQLKDAQGREIVAQTDYERQRGLVKMRAAGQLVYVEYYEGNSGWQWLQGKKTPLTPARMKELTLAPYLGVAGLNRERIATLRKGTVSATEDGGYVLSYQVNGQTLKLIFDQDFQLVGEEKPSASGTVAVAMSRFKKVDGVLLPFNEKQTAGSQKVEFRVSDYLINQLGEKDWEVNLP
ncbi:hypothetical protein GCM10027275_50920 [Rhabdobacter roseus]|uniref:Lipoprotein n=1 Tax=Rhabdobacter roseus TaxID=1655419 RepID=A0A840TW61_9BACT|nr:hypothetical protein [Rhabdobacter roseus]MBB5287165.1 hypothetical protein [Rhabdobacter roseus]